MKKPSPEFILGNVAQALVEYVVIAAIMALFALGAARAVSAAFGAKFVKTAALRMIPAP